MLIDGHEVAEHVYARASERRAQCTRAPRLTIIACDPTAVTERYLARKEAAADQLDVTCVVERLARDATTEVVAAAVDRAVQESDAVIVQLPLPAQIDRTAVLSHIPATHDVDALTDMSPFLSPVAGAIQAIARYYAIPIAGQSVVVLGAGLLVGRPVAAWCEEQGASVTVITETTPDTAALAAADVVISGVGQPGLVQPTAIKSGVVLFDAATAELSGKLRGDIDPACYEKAAYATPVPGGIGPVTIAVLLEQVIAAADASGENG